MSAARAVGKARESESKMTSKMAFCWDSPSQTSSEGTVHMGAPCLAVRACCTIRVRMYCTGMVIWNEWLCSDLYCELDSTNLLVYAEYRRSRQTLCTAQYSGTVLL